MLIKLAKKSLVMLAAKLRNTSFCNKMGFLKVLVKGHIILFDKTLVLTKDHERERYTPFLCNHLGDHWEKIQTLCFCIFSISANHQLLRESELLRTPTQAKDISKPAYICV